MKASECLIGHRISDIGHRICQNQNLQNLRINRIFRPPDPLSQITYG